MLKLTYLFHSGFVLETEGCILIFDYWMDPSNSLPNIMKQAKGKQVYVFASHFHADHFTRDIFKWKELYPYDHFTYILSKDIKKHHRAQSNEADVWMAKGTVWNDSNIKVSATGSNDSGVSWIVDIADLRIFHAGDLCNWYARFLANNDGKEVVYSKEFNIWINPINEEKRFLGELKDIRKITDSFDLVMFPVDGRIGNGYTRGARQFIQQFKTALFVPMHFVMSGFEAAWRMKPFCDDQHIPFWSIQAEGESITLAYDCIIRHATIADIPRLKKIFSHARAFMTKTGNPHQWTANYPNDELLHHDIMNNDCYVVIHDHQVEASFVLHNGIEPAYATIHNGAWLNNEPYATLHRVASSGKVKGMFHLIMLFAKMSYNNLRIDTHQDNKVMQRAIVKENFKYCGRVHYPLAGERLGYHFVK